MLFVHLVLVNLFLNTCMSGFMRVVQTNSIKHTFICWKY